MTPDTRMLVRHRAQQQLVAQSPKPIHRAKSLQTALRPATRRHQLLERLNHRFIVAPNQHLMR
jgi:hypothetical protein